MGAWGSGSFENDAALDWAASVQSPADLHGSFDRLKALKDARTSPAPFRADADLASALVAAAETVAMLMGRTIPGFPEDLRERLAGAGEPEPALYHRARTALFDVLHHSELAELWAEAAEESGVNEWHAAISSLVDRLNPDIDFVPWTPAEIKAQTGKTAGPCAFCDRPIAIESLFGMEIRDYSDKASFGTQGLFFHLACLNARLHHKHAIVNLKFDPDNMPGPD